MLSHDSTNSLKEADKAELNKLVSVLEISSGTTIIFAIAPENSPQHPVVEKLKENLATSEEKFKFNNFFYSQNSFHNFLYSLDDKVQQNQETERKLVMAFGIDQLPTPRLVREMKQLNLGREELFGRNLTLILWLNKTDFLDEFRQRAPDFWDWREKVVQFETRNLLLYPYLEWLIAENSYLKMSRVMQVNRQVDIFLDQIYVSLEAQWRQEVTDTSERSQRNIEVLAWGSSSKGMDSSIDDGDKPYYYESISEEAISIPVSSTKKVTQKVDLSEAVRQNNYSVILGAPGAGKTTLLRYLALHFAIAKRDNLETVLIDDDSVDNYIQDVCTDNATTVIATQGSNPTPLETDNEHISPNINKNCLNKHKKQKELGKTLLPIFFRIADYAEKLKQQPDLTLLEYLRQFYRQWETHCQIETNIDTEEVAEFLLLRMRQGQCLMLLDGLDEVFDQESRKLIVERINQFVDGFPHNKFVITSRIAGYRDVQLSSRFAEFTIEDMNSEQVERFLYRWCRTVEKAQQPDASKEQWYRKGNEQVRDILQAIEDNEGVKRLTANPLLLTILALIHRNGERLPNRRVRLYELAVRTLTEDWQLGKKLPDAPRVMLKETEVVELLAPLAYWMHEEKPSGVVSQEEVEEKLAQKLAELNDDDPESETVRQAVGEFLRKVRETTGLFVERTPGFYGFMHLTFEEYFAARYIADNDQSEILQLIQKHLHEPRWDEPILLALGYYGIHFPSQVKKLLEKLFQNLKDYQPSLQQGEIKIKNPTSDDAVIRYLTVIATQESNPNYITSPNQDLPADNLNPVIATQVSVAFPQGNSNPNHLTSPNECVSPNVKQDKSANNLRELEFKLKNLLFAGQVIAEIEVNSNFRKKLIDKLIITYLCIDADFEDDTTKQLLRLLRKIELFHHKGEVIHLLKQTANDSNLSEEIQVKAKTAILYIACGESAELVDYVIGIVNELEPSLFCSIRDLVQEMGDEMTPTLENISQYHNTNENCQKALTFLTAMSYLRKDKYDKAIEIFEKINQESDNSLRSFICWALAKCYEEKEDYEKSNNYYWQSQITDYHPQNSLFIFWRHWGWCQRLDEKYEQSLEYYEKALAIATEIESIQNEANIYYNIARVYQDWGKYEQAINYHQQSRDIYQQLGKDKSVAVQWSWLVDCYREWGKYNQAIECENQEIDIFEQLDDQVNIALAYWRFGKIYQSWGKYERAINYHQKSRELYQQLGKDENIATQWLWLSLCYREWGKYERAIECENQDLVICQQLDNQVGIALAYRVLGRIYKDWGKYEQAVNYYQQSQELYQELGKDKNIADLWFDLASCYREWGKYEQAIECENQDLAIRQQLDDQVNIADAYYQLGRIFQDWGKYQQAIEYYQQSRELYQQLGKDKDVANRSYSLANCYREWGKYEQAIECENQDLAIRQQLDDQVNIARAYFQLGWIYKDWGKYQQAIEYYQQSRELYQQLGKDKDVANRWYSLANCYREWGKYEQAIECENQDLAIRQRLDDQVNIADAYYQLGRIYQDWGQYQQAVNYYQQSRDLYQHLGKDNNVANQWYWLGDSYREWGKYDQAIEFQNQCLAIRQQLDNQVNIANAYFQLGRIYQDWGKYQQAINYHQQSRELYQQLGKDKNVAYQWYWLATCYREWGKYEKSIECEKQELLISQRLDDQVNIADAHYQLGRIYKDWGKYQQAINYYQQSRELYQQLGKDSNVARCYRQIAYCQCLLAKNTSNSTEISNLLTQAEENIHQAIDINIRCEYKENLAYDYTTLSLLYSEYLRFLPSDDTSIQEKIALFEENYHRGLTYLDELGQTVNKAEKFLDLARAYLEVEPLENLNRSEEIAKECLQIFQEYNRRKLQASALKLLGEIYLKCTQQNQSSAKAIATEFLAESLQIYQDLDLQEKAGEVELLMHPS